MTSFERVAEGVLVDDFAAGDFYEDAARLHQAKAAVVEEAVRLRRPLAADHHEIAGREVAVEIIGPAELAEPWRPRLTGCRVAPRAEQTLPRSSPRPPPPTTQAVLPSTRSGR